MKRKIAYTVITVALVVSAFLVGKSTTKWQDSYNKSTADVVVDWNTDGSELAMFLSDGTELYAYKSENIYSPEHKNYIPLQDIESVDGNQIITKDGNVYSIEENK